MNILRISTFGLAIAGALFISADTLHAQSWTSDAVNGELETNPTTTEVGIGTTAPARRLEVVHSGSPQLRLGEGSNTSTWDIFAGGNFLVRKVVSGVSTDWIQLEDVAHTVRIGPGSEFFINLNAGSVGNTGIGTTSPVSRLTVEGTITPGVDCNANYNLGSTTRRWNIVYACNGLLTSSDAQLKEDIQDIPYGLDAVMRLHPVQFNWKNDPAYGTKLGLVAQEVQSVVSEVVKGGENGEALGMFYGDLIPVLIKAIQDQQSIIDGQSDRISRLESELKISGVNTGSGSDVARIMTITPNPATNVATISYHVPGTAHEAILTISEVGTGREVRRQAVTDHGNGQVSVNLEGLSAGTYLYSLLIDGKVSSSRVAVVNR